jgi:hypothetical protein
MNPGLGARRNSMLCLLSLAALVFGLTASAQDQTRSAGWVRGKDLAWSPFASVTNLIPHYHAIVIGINDYGVKPPIGWDSLSTAREDAEEVANVLEKNYNFKVTRLLDKDATRNAIISALDQLTTLTVDDAVLVYYAGHGLYDEKLGEGFWIPYGARQKGANGLPREDWIWNSTLTKIIGASEARHVLVVSDSCYSGSLFRGAELSAAKPDLTWYRRAISRPSRYLITSGDMEPVLDSGTKHSIFAQSLINCMSYPEKSVFSASDLGVILRSKVSTLTGQMVRMGPLSVPAHAGGEFVFLANNSTLADLDAKPDKPAVAAAGQNAVARGDALAEPIKLDVQQVLKDAALMNEQGATNMAKNTLGVVLKEQPDNQTARTIAAYFDHAQREKNRTEILNLVDKIEKQKASAGKQKDDWSTYARPRILACLGPDSQSGSADAESLALLCRIAMRSALQATGGVIVVEREALQDILQEQQLGSSDLADPKAHAAIGKLLPASLLLLGEVLPHQKYNDVLYMRLVDTETTRVLATFSQTIEPGQDVSAICGSMAGQIAAKITQVKPFTGRVVGMGVDASTVKARVGRFHGVADNAVFAVVQRTYANGKSQDEFTEKEIGRAKIVAPGELESDLQMDHPLKSDAAALQNIWVREIPSDRK